MRALPRQLPKNCEESTPSSARTPPRAAPYRLLQPGARPAAPRRAAGAAGGRPWWLGMGTATGRDGKGRSLHPRAGRDCGGVASPCPEIAEAPWRGESRCGISQPGGGPIMSLSLSFFFFS